MNSNVNSGVLELKLHKVYFATFRSPACKAEENFSAKCTECRFNPNVNKEVAKYPDAKLARQRVLGLPLS